MPSRHDSTVHLAVDPSAPPMPLREREAPRVQVLLLADFAGRRGRGAGAADPMVRPVDRDSVDEALAAFAPALSLGGNTSISFRSLDDFHPDTLLHRVPALGAALDGRDPGEAAEAAEGASGAGAEAGRSGGGRSGAGVLDAILDEVAPERSTPSAGGTLDSIRAFAAEAARFDAAAPGARGDDGRAARAAHALLAFLRVPAFRDLERRWRAVDFIVRRLETGPDLRVFLGDLSREALGAEARGPGGLEASALARVLRAGAGPDGEPYTYVALLDGTVGPSPDDQILLAWTTALCAAFGATLLVDGDPRLAGIPSLDDFDEPSSWGPVDPAWAAFRAQPEAGAVATAAPGFLLRVPYGPDTAPLDALPDFEEIAGTPRRDDYLLGPAVAAVVVALARARLRDDDGRPPDLAVGDVPLHAWTAGVDRGVVGGAVAMTDGAARRLLEGGVIPVAWARGDDRVRLLVPRTAGGTKLP